MNIFLNGEERQIADKASVHDLLVELGYADKRLAVELNGDIVPRSAHPETLLKEGDRLEIVIAVGGG